MSKNVILTDVNNDQILPITTANNVFTANDRTVTDDFVLVNSRIDNVVTTPAHFNADAELTDLRIGADAVTYNSAGEAVRTQFDNVATKIEDTNDNLDKQSAQLTGHNNRINGNANNISQLFKDVSDLEESKASQTDLETLEARMDAFVSLPPGSTAGNEELLDIRNGADGETYSTAGNAVRTQFENVTERIDALAPTKITVDRTIVDSKRASAKINAIRGNSEQKIYSGKNLLNATFSTATWTGVTCTANGDGTYTLNGTATETIWFPICSFTDLPLNRQYKLVGSPKGGSLSTYGLMNDAETSYEYGEGNIFTPTVQPKIYIRIASGYTCNNLVFKPMLVDATLYPDVTYDDFEPYVGGMSSPNPLYSQAVNSSGDSGSIAVKAHGKNWLDNKAVSETKSGLAVTANDNKTLSIKGTSETDLGIHINSNFYLSEGTYILNGNPLTDGNSRLFVTINGVHYFDYGNGRTFTITNKSKVEACYMVVAKNITVDCEVKPMIRLATEDATYEPYTESTFTIPLSEPLRGIDDVKDEIVKKDGVWGVYRRIKNASIKDIIQAWMIGGKAEKGYQTFFARVSDMLPSSLSTNIASDKFTVTTSTVWDNPNGYLIRKGATENVIYVSVATTDASTVAEMITWTTNNLFNVQYELATPIFEPFPNEYQELFYQFESYDGVTYITTDSTVQPEIELEYALTDAGVHMLNNYSTANIAELKADHNIDLTPAVKYVKESVTVTPDQDIETDVIDLKAVKLKAYDGYNVALTKYLLNFAYDFTEDTTSELVFRIPGVELTDDSLVTASATCGYLKDGDPYLVSVNIYPDVNITTGYINLAISKADGTKFDESITSNHRFTVSVEIL